MTIKKIIEEVKDEVERNTKDKVDDMFIDDLIFELEDIKTLQNKADNDSKYEDELKEKSEEYFNIITEELSKGGIYAKYDKNKDKYFYEREESEDE